MGSARARRGTRWRRVRRALFPRVAERYVPRKGGYGDDYRLYPMHRTHRDAPLTPRAHAAWWVVGSIIMIGGIVLIVIVR